MFGVSMQTKSLLTKKKKKTKQKRKERINKKQVPWTATSVSKTSEISEAAVLTVNVGACESASMAISPEFLSGSEKLRTKDVCKQFIIQ